VPVASFQVRISACAESARQRDNIANVVFFMMWCDLAARFKRAMFPGF
jgi:hypothetical protein